MCMVQICVYLFVYLCVCVLQVCVCGAGVCLCICICICVCLSLCAAGACMGCQRLVSSVLRGSPLYFLRHVPLLKLCFTDWSGWVAHEPQRSVHLCLSPHSPVPRLQVHSASPGFYMNAGD